MISVVTVIQSQDLVRSGFSTSVPLLVVVQERRKTHDTSFQNTSMNELEEWEAACDTKEKNLLSALDTLKRTLKEVRVSLINLVVCFRVSRIFPSDVI